MRCWWLDPWGVNALLPVMCDPLLLPPLCPSLLFYFYPEPSTYLGFGIHRTWDICTPMLLDVTDTPGGGGNRQEGSLSQLPDPSPCAASPGWISQLSHKRTHSIKDGRNSLILLILQFLNKSSIPLILQFLNKSSIHKTLQKINCSVFFWGGEKGLGKGLRGDRTYLNLLGRLWGPSV